MLLTVFVTINYTATTTGFYDLLQGTAIDLGVAFPLLGLLRATPCSLLLAGRETEEELEIIDLNCVTVQKQKYTHH